MPTLSPLKKLAQGLDMSEAARMARMQEMGMERGFFRGGKTPADGPYYARDPEAAEAFGRRHKNADVREYAIERGNSFVFRSQLGAEAIQPISGALEAMGRPDLAKEIAELPADWGGEIPAPMLFQVLDTQTGGDAFAVLKSAGFDTIDAGQELITLSDNLVRDAKRAAFDPAKRGSKDIYASAVPGALGLGLLGNTRLSEAALLPMASGDVGSIEPIDGSPRLLELAAALKKYTDTPAGPMLGGIADLLEKHGWGQRRTYGDYAGAALDLL